MEADTEDEQTCQQGHGPRAERSKWAQGLTRLPPDLAKKAEEWTPAQVHWIVTHRVKMSAMPALGASHDPQTVSSIAAFVKQLPTMTPEAYARVPAEKEEHEEGAHAR